MPYRIYWSVLILSLLTGCSFFHKSSAPAPAPAPVEKTVSRPSEQEYIVIRKERLSKGGNLLVIPFSAGEKVAASDDLDRVALHVIQGMAETLQGKRSKFKWLMADNANTAEVLVRGHITRMSTPGKLKNALPGYQKRTLAVAGEVLDAKTQEVLLKFAVIRKTETRTDNFETLGAQIGVELAQHLAEVAR